MVDKIRAICKQKGTNIKTIESAAGIGNGVVARWDKSSPKVSNLLALCSVLEVPLSAVVDDPYAKENAPAVPGESVLSDIELSLLSSFRDLPEEGQTKLLSYLSDLQMAGIYKRHSPARMAAGK